MRRLLTTAALFLTLVGVVTGNLYRPCDCEAEGQENRYARCHAPEPAKTLPPCCRAANPTGSDSDAPNGEDEGCRICCKPRAATAGAEIAPTLPAPASASLDLAPAEILATDANLCPALFDTTWRRRTIDPRLLSPAGLAVFLI